MVIPLTSERKWSGSARRGKAQFTVELEVLTYGPAAGEKIDGSFQPDLAGRAVEAIWPVVCLLVFRQVEELSVSRMSGWSGGETKRFREPQGLKPLVVLHSVLEISDFAFRSAASFIVFFELRVKGYSFTPLSPSLMKSEPLLHPWGCGAYARAVVGRRFGLFLSRRREEGVLGVKVPR